MKYDFTQYCGNIPDEIKAVNQWCVAVGSKAPKLPGTVGLRNASVIDDVWLSFNDAVTIAKENGGEIGFILTRNDPYVCIDLDVKDPESINQHGLPYHPSEYTTTEQTNRFVKILDTYDSYAELSSSGKGIHVWVKGVLPCGNKRDGVEVYPHERFIICTGKSISKVAYTIGPNAYQVNVIDASIKPVVERQVLLDTMIREITQSMNANPIGTYKLIEHPAEIGDEELFEIASNADNCEKFIDLCNGNWHKYKYPSQSEADNALISMLAFYTKSNEQVRRMFRMTALGKREKAVKNNRYIDRTLTYIRRNQDNKIEIEINLDKQSKELMEKVEAAKSKSIENEPFPEVLTGDLDWPPGNAAKIAKYIYHASPRPVKEISIAATLGLLAGMLGKAYNITHSGLNMYIILVAKSGTGKEAMTTGINRIVNKVKDGVPGISKFVDFNSFVSGPALIKSFANSNSFVNINAEWGHTLKRMADEQRGDSPMGSLRRVMTELYQKSGAGAMAGGLKYSNKDNDVAEMEAVSFSMLGESTPGTFYESLTQTMMEDGLISRLNIIEYTGMRPDANNNIILELPNDLVDLLSEVITHVIQLIGTQKWVDVKLDPASEILSKTFESECDAKLRVIEDEATRASWNRAHLKVLRLASLLAVIDNYINPIIKVEHFEWALDMIRRDMMLIGKRLIDGDIGTTDSSRESKILKVINDYVSPKFKKGYGLKVGEVNSLKQHGLIPYRYIQTRCSNIKSFYAHRNGTRFAITQTVSSLIDSGILIEMSADAGYKATGKSLGRCYRVINLE